MEGPQPAVAQQLPQPTTEQQYRMDLNMYVSTWI
jgi:hypothetical protein